jgi:hypothetical protein
MCNSEDTVKKLREWENEKVCLNEQIKKLKAENKSLLELLKNTENILDSKLKEHKVFAYNIKKLIEYVYPITQSYLSLQQRSTFQEFLDKIKAGPPPANKKVNRKIQCCIVAPITDTHNQTDYIKRMEEDIKDLKLVIGHARKVMDSVWEEHKNVIPTYLLTLLDVGS